MNIANQGKSPSQIVGTLSEWFRRAEEMGITLDDLQRMIDDPNKRRDVISHWKGISTSSVTWARAAKIMGKKAIGIEVASKLGIRLSKIEIARYGLVPCGEGSLEEARDDGLCLAAIPRLNQVQLREKAAPRYLYPSNWYLRREERELFSEVNYSEPGYYLIGALPDSTNMIWLDQEKAVDEAGFQVSLVVELAYAAAGYLALGHGELFSNYLRCRDVDSGGNRCVVGVIEGQVYVSFSWGSCRLSGLGVARRQFLGLTS